MKSDLTVSAYSAGVTRPGDAVGGPDGAGSEGLQIGGGNTAIAALVQYAGHALLVGQPGEAGAPQGRDVHEHLHAAILAGEKAVAAVLPSLKSKLEQARGR